jgi:hypothetical protein
VVARDDEKGRRKPIEESTRLEELIPSSPLRHISRHDNTIWQEVVSLTDHDLGQMSPQRRTKV